MTEKDKIIQEQEMEIAALKKELQAMKRHEEIRQYIRDIESLRKMLLEALEGVIPDERL